MLSVKAVCTRGSCGCRSTGLEQHGSWNRGAPTPLIWRFEEVPPSVSYSKALLFFCHWGMRRLPMSCMPCGLSSGCERGRVCHTCSLTVLLEWASLLWLSALLTRTAVLAATAESAAVTAFESTAGAEVERKAGALFLYSRKVFLTTRSASMPLSSFASCLRTSA